MNNVTQSLATLALSLAVTGCASAPPPESVTWQSLRRSGDSVTIALDADSKIAFTGVVKAEGTDGETTIAVEDLKWFDNWHDGWTEAVISCEGLIAAKKEGAGWTVRATEPVTPVRATTATIRYRDALLRGTEARNLLDRRLLRIRSTCDFLRSRLEGREFPIFDTDEEEYERSSFRRAAGMVLFPEVYGYAKDAEPESGETRDRDRYRKGEGLRWDTLYSERELPPEIREVRDTGTLWRDWEETGRLFYYIYMMERK